MGCGVCVGHCEADAVVLKRDESLPLPLDMQQLIQTSVKDESENIR
jgi:ferredoxin